MYTVCYRDENHNTLGKLFFSKTKEPIPKSFASDLIYSIPCGDCSGHYVGETCQYLSKRIYQHKYDVRKISKESSPNHLEGTALAQHAKITEHNFNFDKVSVLARENNSRKRKLREAIEIMKSKNAVNFKTDTDKLGTMYGTVIAYLNQ